MSKNIGLTMRLDISPHGEKRICVDTAWFSLLESFGFEVTLLPFAAKTDQADVLRGKKIDALILTGGNDVDKRGETYSQERNDFEFSLLDQAARNGVPVVGICRGMQVMNVHQNGTVSRIDHHVARPHELQWNGKTLTVNSFHDYGIGPADLSSNFIVDATAQDGSIESFHHKTYNWHGVMWHPERSIESPELHRRWLADKLAGR